MKRTEKYMSRLTLEPGEESLARDTGAQLVSYLFYRHVHDIRSNIAPHCTVE